MKSLFTCLKKSLVAIGRDSLTYMLAIGLIVFFAFEDEPADSTEIVVTPELVHQLSEQFHHTYLRHPNPEEHKLLVDSAVMDLALYYEGLANKLDMADEIVKRRIVQKMNFIIEGMADPGRPEHQELLDYLTENSDQFELPPSYDFEHRYIKGTSVVQREVAIRMLLALRQGDVIENDAKGDYFLRGQRFQAKEPLQINKIMGGGFAANLKDQPIDKWLGPIKSSYGYHLVKIQRVKPSRVPNYSEIPDRVYAAWKKRRQEENVAAIKASVLAQYKVSGLPSQENFSITGLTQTGTPHVAAK